MLEKGISALTKDCTCWIRSWALLANKQPIPAPLSFHYQRVKILFKLLNQFSYWFHRIQSGNKNTADGGIVKIQHGNTGINSGPR